jgi:hypothetical protein
VTELHRASPAELRARIEAERRGNPFLLYRDGDGAQRIVELSADRPRVYLGRHPSSDVPLPWDEEVSRLHADVECISGLWTIVDDGRSRNGTWVNTERLHGRRALQPGDVITVGSTRLSFHAPASEAFRSTAAAKGELGPAVSPSQRRVLVALCRPLATGRMAIPPSNRELAEELSLGVETVKSHLHALFESFGLEDTPQFQKRATLARAALERGVVSEHDLV